MREECVEGRDFGLTSDLSFQRHGFDGTNTLRHRARLLIACADQPGIVAAVSSFLYAEGANILQSDQYSSDSGHGQFFMRVEFELASLPDCEETLRNAFESVAAKFSMQWELTLASLPKRIAIFVSKEEHCLLELLWQWQVGDLYADIKMIVSNHRDAETTALAFGIPFYHVPVSADSKLEAEARQLEIVRDQVDLIILARYMQILSPAFVQSHRNRIINIHHSFLPAFIGKNPYGRAYERGVKLIGATAHYVTEDLDAGPIIEQDVQRVDHRDEVEDLKRIGRHVERTVLAKAVKWHLEDRVLINENKTIVFV